LTGLGLGHRKIYRIHSGFAGWNCMGGFSQQTYSRRYTVKAKGRKASTTTWPSNPSQMSAPGYWAVICSDRFGVHGTTGLANRARDGGVTILHITHLFL